MYGHPAVMKLYDSIECSRHLYLVTEMCPGVTAHSMIKEINIGSSRKNLPEPICAAIMYCIISGLQFIHNLKISHRDLKLENILIDPKTYTTKLIDFGFAVKGDSENQTQTAFCGTAGYMSP